MLTSHSRTVLSYDPDNHELMVKLRAEKVERVANDIPPVEVVGDQAGELLVLGWGSTLGAITGAVDQARAEGLSVSRAHLRYLNPFPSDLGDVLSRFDRVIVPELNLGQLAWMLRARYLVDVETVSRVQGRPFKSQEIVDAVRNAPKENSR